MDGAGGRRRVSRRRSNRLLLALAWMTLALVGLFFWYGHDLPDLSNPLTGGDSPTITILAVDGQRLSFRGEAHSERVAWRDLPRTLVQAVLATEDRRFFHHIGFDIIGIGRALLANLTAMSVRQGGSTITQQLAKILFFSPERSLRRKIQEVMAALALEARYSKESIFTAYLNRAYFGAGLWGVAAASRLYFGKSVRDLDLYESALLAGLLKAPSRYAPTVDAHGAHRRALEVLRSMADAGYIEPWRTQHAAGRRLETRGKAAPHALETHYFIDWILPQLAPYAENADEDLIVITTLDIDLQRQAARRLLRVLAGEGRRRNISEGAVVLMTAGGEVRALIGGRDYAASHFNRVTSAMRQPGSAFKLFVYLTALEDGFKPDSVFIDAPLAIEDWSPRNFDGGHEGEVSMSDAFARSLNTVAVLASELSGRQRVRAAARRLGVTASLPRGPALALGAANVNLMEMTAAYAVFANDGRPVNPSGIREIRKASGEILYRHRDADEPPVVAFEQVRDMNAMLSHALHHGTGRAAAPGRPAAGKTGTSQGFRDALFVGFTADYAAGVWLGNDDESPMLGVTGGSAPARLWREVMLAAHRGAAKRALPGLAGGGQHDDVGALLDELGLGG